MPSKHPFPWPAGRRGAVSLSYDDALPCHHQHVAPLLQNAGLRGTFYTSILSPFMRDIRAWEKLAARGHELGNHTLFHPCRADSLADASWLAPWCDLADYSADRWMAEVRVASFILSRTDGKLPGERTFGNTCGNTHIGPKKRQTPLAPMIADLFVAARGRGTGKVIDPRRADMIDLGCCGGDGRTFADLRCQVEQAIAIGGWIIFCTHGVGRGTHGLFMDRAEHRKFVQWLGRQRQEIWIAPVVEVAKHIRQRR